MSNSELSCSDSSFFSSSLSFSVNGGLFLEPAVSNNSFFRWVSPAAEQSFGKGSSVSSLSNLCRFKAVGVGGGRFFLVSLTSDGIVRETKRCLVQNGYEDAVVEERKKKNKKIRVRKGAAVNTTKHLWAGTIVAMVSRQQKLNHLEGLMAILGMMRPNILEFEVSNLHTRKQSGLFVLCTTRTAYFNFRVGERITKVSGHVGIVPGATTMTPVVRSITFTTNENIYGPYGVEEGEPFEANIPIGAHISGFFGRTSDDYLNAIGFYQSKHDGVQDINVISNGGVVNIVNVTYNLKDAVPAKFISSGGSNLTATVGNVTFTSTSSIAG